MVYGIQPSSLSWTRIWVGDVLAQEGRKVCRLERLDEGHVQGWRWVMGWVYGRRPSEREYQSGRSGSRRAAPWSRLNLASVFHRRERVAASRSRKASSSIRFVLIDGAFVGARTCTVVLVLVVVVALVVMVVVVVVVAVVRVMAAFIWRPNNPPSTLRPFDHGRFVDCGLWVVDVRVSLLHPSSIACVYDEREKTKHSSH